MLRFALAVMVKTFWESAPAQPRSWPSTAVSFVALLAFLWAVPCRRSSLWIKNTTDPDDTELGFFTRPSPLTLTTMSSPEVEERELTTRQAALIDSAFEEGQYESGIAMLEQLCSPTDHPSR
jgi:hypothetical protein